MIRSPLSGDVQEHQLQYSPSAWVKAVPSAQAVPCHIHNVTEVSLTVRKKVPNSLDLRYGEREGQLFDLYGTDLPTDSPMFVYIHGGYWQMLCKNISAYPVIPLWEVGIKSIIVGYDLAPTVTLNVIVEEIRELAVYILKMSREEKCRGVWFGGHSAGAHLVASLLETDFFNSLQVELKQQLKGVVLISGIYDLTPLIHTSVNDALQLTRKDALKQSPLFKLEELVLIREIIALMVIGEHDSPAFQEQTKAYIEVLKKKNIETNLTCAIDTDHFTVVSNLQYPSYTVTQNIIALIMQSIMS